MIEIYAHEGEDFAVMTQFEGWKIGMISHSERFSRFAVLERHLCTDEAFVLLLGEATLYTDRETVKMEKGKVYNIPAGVWHHIVVSEDARVLVVENSNTSKENSEKKYMDEKEKGNADK